MLFVFPPEIPVSVGNMNYCIVAFGVILLIAGTTWILDGRKHYKGPQLDVDAMLDGKILGAEPLQVASDSEKPTVQAKEGDSN